LFARGRLPAGFVKQASIALEEFFGTDGVAAFIGMLTTLALRISIEDPKTGLWFHLRLSADEVRTISNNNPSLT